MGGIESKTTQINSNQVFANNKTENFRKIEFCGSTKDANPSVLPRNEKSPRYLRKTPVTLTDGYYYLGLLWRDEFRNFTK